MLKIVSYKDNISIDEFGGKAYWLSWLIKEGYNVPYAICISANSSITEVNKLKNNQDFKNQLSPFLNTDKYSVAVRSSGILEDNSQQSLAGHYKTLIGDYSYNQVIHSIKTVIQSNDSVQNGMGIVIQSKIESAFSGVIFSSNILNGSKDEVILEIIQGMGENLVSGKEIGETLIINKNSKIPKNRYKLQDAIIQKIINIAISIENKLNFPVDIEWSIDNLNNIHILQCRPITSFQPSKSGIIEITLENEKYIPKDVLTHDKVKIRLFAKKYNINMSKAYLAIIPHLNKGQGTNLELGIIEQNKQTKGFSTVLVYPKNINGKIVRYFAKTEIEKDNILYRGCYREKVKTLENINSLSNVLINIGHQSSKYSWLTVIIIQEIYQPKYTGIIKSINEGYVIEIVKGFFLQKGLVSPTQYIIGFDGTIIYKNEIYQNEYYDIENGKTQKKKFGNKIKISQKTLLNIIEEFKVILNDSKKAVEFGIYSEKDNLIPYLIDFIEENVSDSLSSNELNSGVVSKGIITGQLVKNLQLDIDSINLHFHDSNSKQDKKNGKYIFMYKKPDIALLKLLEEYNNENIGFIFEEASILSHLPIVLRERNIPAIIKNRVKFNDGEIIQINTESKTLKKVNGYVFPYINPDADGVCSTVAYNFLNNSFKPIIFGDFDNETCFIFNHFNYRKPVIKNSIEDEALIALVDTHHISQLPTNINYDNVIEIIDHHTAGDIDKFPNAQIYNLKVGSACSILVERMIKSNLIINEDLAGILGLSIISNTLNFTAPSTDKRDKIAFQWLQQFCTISDDLIKEMFKARSNFDNISNMQIINQNTKIFVFNQKTIGICQLEMVDINNFLNDEFYSDMNKYKVEKNMDYFLFSGIDIFKQTTILRAVDKISVPIIENALKCKLYNNEILIQKIVLRKTDLIPKLKQYLEVSID